jgi:hypothetical protein
MGGVTNHEIHSRPIPAKYMIPKGRKDKSPVSTSRILEKCFLTDMADRDIGSWLISLNRLVRRFALPPGPGKIETDAACIPILHTVDGENDLININLSHIRWHDQKPDALHEMYCSLSQSVYETVPFSVFLSVSVSLNSSYFESITHV